MRNFRLDRKGGAEVLKELAAAAIKDLADQVADQVGEGAQVKTYVTDRAVAAVSVPAEMQAKDGALTRAAAAVGLEVRPPKRGRKPKPKTRKPAAKAAKGKGAQ